MPTPAIALSTREASGYSLVLGLVLDLQGRDVAHTARAPKPAQTAHSQFGLQWLSRHRWQRHIRLLP